MRHVRQSNVQRIVRRLGPVVAEQSIVHQQLQNVVIAVAREFERSIGAKSGSDRQQTPILQSLESLAWVLANRCRWTSS